MENNFLYHFDIFKKSKVFIFISKYTDISREHFQILMNHGIAVARLALKACNNISHLNPDVNLIFQGALLHDIGCIYTDAPEIDCYGNHPYIKHGILGAKILEEGGFLNLASICKTHIGVGIKKNEIISNKIPLPPKDYIPLTIEEKCVAWADKFYSKTPGKIYDIKPVSKILKNLENYSHDKTIEFLEWNKLFGKNIL